MSRIYYASLSRYWKDLGLPRSDFDRFSTLIRAMDDEFIAVMAERDKADRDRLEQQGRA